MSSLHKCEGVGKSATYTVIYHSYRESRVPRPGMPSGRLQGDIKKKKKKYWHLNVVLRYFSKLV